MEHRVFDMYTAYTPPTPFDNTKDEEETMDTDSEDQRLKTQFRTVVSECV